jgi:hypothetical protein
MEPFDFDAAKIGDLSIRLLFASRDDASIVRRSRAQRAL